MNNLDDEFKRLSIKIENESKTQLEIESKVILTQLVMETPVDTGRARSGWNLAFSGNKAILDNEVPYIEALNNGHSRQAPKHFVEQIALQHGKPLGAITTVKS